jgi:hypothetical protein
MDLPSEDSASFAPFARSARGYKELKLQQPRRATMAEKKNLFRHGSWRPHLRIAQNELCLANGG